MKIILVIVGLAIGAFGLIMGFGSVSPQGLACGAPWHHPDFVLDLSGQVTDPEAVCADARSARTPLALGGTLIGAALLASGAALAFQNAPVKTA